MNNQEAINSLKNIIEYWTYKPTEVEACRLAISALERQLELENLGFTEDVIENYKIFEDELIAKGFTFNSLVGAREKQIPKKLKYYAETEEDFAHVKCPNCKNVLETVPLLFKNNYCDECGQKLDWSVEEC